MYINLFIQACGNDHLNNRKNNNSREELYTPVQIMPLIKRHMKDILILPAEVKAWQDVSLGAGIGGKIDYIGVKEGERVNKGDIIAKINIKSLTATLAKAKTAYELAENNFNRVNAIYKKNIATKQDLDKIIAERDSAQANLNLAQAELEKGMIISPVKGYVDRLPLEQGEFVKQGELVARIVEIDKVKIIAAVSEKDIRLVKDLKKADVYYNSSKDEFIIGKIYYVALSADEQTKTFPLKIELDNSKHFFRPGMIIRIGLKRYDLKEALAVPFYSIIHKDGENLVFTEQEGRAHMHKVETGFLQDNWVQIINGLQENDRIIIKGQRDLTDQAKVKVIKEVQDAYY